jgi:hypothetical protein
MDAWPAESLGEGANVFIVAVTDLGSPEDSAQPMAIGFERHCGLPITLETIRMLLTDAEAASPAE